MPKPPNIQRPTKLHLALPEDVRAKLDLFLYSQVEGRIPHGAYQKFLVERIQEYFSRTDVSVLKLAAAIVGKHELPKTREHLLQIAQTLESKDANP